MKKSFKLENLDCAHCAAKMEEAIRKLEGVASANINFFAQKLTIEGDDARFDWIVKEAAEACRKVEPDCTLVVK
jgi:copper chaperone CopZ